MTAFTFFHVVLILTGIVAGVVVLCGLVTANRVIGGTLVFLATTLATSATGFLFAFKGGTPAIILGVQSLIALAAIISGRYAFHLSKRGTATA